MSTGQDQGAQSAGRRLVLVVGVGRSGTSLFTGILGQLGFRVPQPEVQADDTNPKGFGEPRWVVDFHNRLMRERRIKVFDSRPVAWDQASETAQDDAVYHELRSWLEVQFTGADHVVVKDPRIGWFLPLWMRCAADLGVTPSFVTMLRHPAEILNSARRSYGTWQTDASRAASWLHVMLQTEYATRGEQRVFVRYEDLMADWAREVARVGEVLDIDLLRSPSAERKAAVDAFVDPSLRRSKVDWSATPVPAVLQAMVEKVWEEFRGLAEPDGDGPASQATLDGARREYVQFYADVEAIAQSSVTAVKPQKKKGPASAAGGTKGGAASRSASGALPYEDTLRRLARKVPAKYRRRVPDHWKRRARRTLSKARSAVRR